MPSPQLVPAPLPSPPPFPRRISSRSRLHLPVHPSEPPIPPRLVGSPLLDKFTHPDPATLTPKIQKQLWFDGDEFGTRARTSNPAPNDKDQHTASPFQSQSPSSSSPDTPRSASSRRSHRRSPSIVIAHRARSHSPPPPQQLLASVPPVPPIPSSAFDSPGARRSVLRTPPTRSRAIQIVIPDLSGTQPFLTGYWSTAALRYSSLSPRARSSASPRRRGVGTESH